MDGFAVNLPGWDDDPEETAAGATAEDKDTGTSFYFASLDEFVQHKLSTAYAREMRKTMMWCPQWWLHEEAISRLEALWRSWEHLRLDGATGMSVWWKDHADVHMRVLFSTDGPFQGCTPARGHAPQVQPLPVEPAPEGLFPSTT